MNQKPLTEKSRILEESFFREHDQELLEYLRSQAQESNLRSQLSEISGIVDTEVLDALIRAGITAESLSALSLLPMVRVAWADAKVQGNERQAILQAAHAEGVSADSTSYRLLDSWLNERPEPSLLEAWWEYARGLARELDETSLAAMRRMTLDRARRVAEAAGGLLGFGNQVSSNEELVLADLARAFEKPIDLK
jgi:hypothetical protein